MTLPRYAPMLAVSWDAPFDDPGWAFEPKYDGVRLIITVDGGKAVLRTRAGNDATASYPELHTLAELPDGSVLDGEVVAFDDQGVPSFEELQGRMHRQGGSPTPINLIAFDLLALAGEELVDQPLEERLGRLADLELPNPAQTSLTIAGDGLALFESTGQRGLEGIVAKKYGSTYRPGTRSPNWRKIPHILRARAVVGGFTDSTTGRTDTFGALLLGMIDGPTLRYVGSVGTGFDHAASSAIRQALDQMETNDSPFADDPAIPEGHFVHPHLVAEIAFKQWTRAGRLRAPSFKGFSDRSADEITWELEGP